MKKFYVFLCFVLIINLFSCRYGPYLYYFGEADVDERSSSFANVEAPSLLPGDAGVYSFLVISDSHFGSPTNFREDDFFNSLNKLLEDTSDEYIKNLRFAINLGDVADFGVTENYESYNKFMGKVASIIKEKNGLTEFKNYAIPGNHDLYRMGWENFKKNIEPHNARYYFDLDSDGNEATPSFRFLFLDTANSMLGNTQLEQLKTLLSEKKPSIVFSHYSLYGSFLFTMQNTIERNKLIKYFSDSNVMNVFEGHSHKNNYYELSDIKVNTVPSFLYDGEFYVVLVDEVNATTSVKHYKY